MFAKVLRTVIDREDYVPFVVVKSFEMNGQRVLSRVRALREGGRNGKEGEQECRNRQEGRGKMAGISLGVQQKENQSVHERDR